MNHLKVKLSDIEALGFDFAAAIKEHIKALQAHQMEVDTAAPTAHPLVERAIFRARAPGQPDTFVPNYEVIDDTPPKPTLEERKDQLERSVHDGSHAAIRNLMPARKYLLLNVVAQQAYGVEPAARTPQQKIAIVAKEQYDAAVAAVHRHVAGQLFDIEDLTEETVDGWLMTPFPHG